MSFAIFYLTGLGCTALNALCFGWRCRWDESGDEVVMPSDDLFTWAMIAGWPLLYFVLAISYGIHLAKAGRAKLVNSIVAEVEQRMGQGG